MDFFDLLIDYFNLVIGSCHLLINLFTLRWKHLCSCHIELTTLSPALLVLNIQCFRKSYRPPLPHARAPMEMTTFAFVAMRIITYLYYLNNNFFQEWDREQRAGFCPATWRGCSDICPVRHLQYRQEGLNQRFFF